MRLDYVMSATNWIQEHLRRTGTPLLYFRSCPTENLKTPWTDVDESLVVMDTSTTLLRKWFAGPEIF